MKKLTKENWLELAFFAFILLVWLAWAWILPFNEGPDEYMRSRIVDYIVEYGKLPTGYQQEIMDYSWGFTYGFRPILPQMVEALFVRIAMLVTKDAFSLIFAGRLVSVVCGLIFAGYVRAISVKLFDRIVDSKLGVRRLNLTALNVIDEDSESIQLDMFSSLTDDTALEQEKKAPASRSLN